MGASVVVQAWLYPVKSLGGEQVEASWADERGLAGDRVWAVQDGDGKLGSGKNTRRFRRIAGLLELGARYLDEPGADGIEPPAVTGPDGTGYPVASGAADAFLRQATGLPEVRVRRDTGIMDQPLCLAVGGHIIRAGTIRVGDAVQAPANREKSSGRS